MTDKYRFVYVEPNISKHGIIIKWEIEKFGFGEFILQVFNKRMDIQGECMSADFVEALLKEAAPKLAQLLKKYEKENPQTDEEIEKHLKDLNNDV